MNECKADRNKQIYNEVQSGMMLKEVGARYGLSVSRVQQIHSREKRDTERQYWKYRQHTKSLIDSIERKIRQIDRYIKWSNNQALQELREQYCNLIDVYGDGVIDIPKYKK